MRPAIRRRPFLPLFVTPAVLVAAAIVAALAAILRYSLHAYLPGSLEVGGFTLENFTDLTRPIVLRALACRDQAGPGGGWR